jgi:hypothetical protein
VKIPMMLQVAADLVILWASLALFFIEKYNQAYNRFWQQLSSIAGDPERIERTKKDCDETFCKLVIWITVVWSTACVVTALGSPRSFISFLSLYGIQGWSDVYTYVVILVMLVLAHLTAIGIASVLHMMYVCLAVTKTHWLRLDPFNADRAGGYSCFVKFSLRTLLLFSTGALFIPALYEFSQTSSSLIQFGVGILVSTFSAFIIFVYVFPCFIVFGKAKKEKEILLHHIADQYRLLMSEHPVDVQHSILLELRFQRLKDELMLYEGISTFPFSAGVVFKLISTALIPLIVFFTQLLCDTGSVLYNLDKVKCFF